MTNRGLAIKIKKILPFWECEGDIYKQTMEILESNNEKLLTDLYQFIKDYSGAEKVAEEIEKRIEKAKIYYDDYIVFLLGCDCFKVCDKIRKQASKLGADILYFDCIYLASMFHTYDSNNNLNISQYDSLCKFLEEYENEIDEYLENGTGFVLKQD